MPIIEGTYTDGKISGKAPMDGQGGPEPIPQKKAEHRHIYYRLYTKDGPLESNNPLFSNDRFISRISSKSVRPPHTAASLKRYLCKIEGFEGPENSALYLSLSEKAPVDDPTRVALRASSGSGSSEFDPVVLVLDTGSAEKRTKAANKVDSNDLHAWKVEERFVYYRLYDEDGEAVSKTSFDETDSSLGRVNAFSIPPPHTVASLKHCLVKAEAISDQDVELLEDEDGEVSMKDSDAIALLTHNFLGCKEDQPIVVTFGRKPSNQTAAPHPSFSKRLTATSNWAGASLDPTWHSITTGETFQTDGVHRTELLMSGSTRYEFYCYVGINSSGRKAFVHSAFATLS